MSQYENSLQFGCRKIYDINLNIRNKRQWFPMRRSYISIKNVSKKSRLRNGSILSLPQCVYNDTKGMYLSQMKDVKLHLIMVQWNTFDIDFSLKSYQMAIRAI